MIAATQIASTEMQLKDSYLAKLLLVIIAYYLSGRLGLLLTIPPGHATAIWPASGIGLAAVLIFGIRYWPAIFIGAMGTSLYHPEMIDSQAVLVAALIASGASLQALLGAYLLRQQRARGFDLGELPDIGKLIFLGGFVSCLISATVGAATLHLAGFVPLADAPFHWFTWWAGDVIGVLVFTPTLLLLFESREKVSRSRQMIVGNTLLVVFLLVVLLFQLAKDQDSKQRELEFQNLAARVAQGIEKDLALYSTVLTSTESFVASSESLCFKDYEAFTEKLVERYPGLQSLSWNPKVTAMERDAFEASIREQGFPNYSIRDCIEKGTMAVAPTRQVYFPITYIVPVSGNERAHGFDTNCPDEFSGNIHRRIMQNAIDSDAAVATDRIAMMQAESDHGLIAYKPVFNRFGSDSAREMGNVAVRGFVSAVFVFEKMLNVDCEVAEQLKLDFVLSDLKAAPEKRVLFDSRATDTEETGGKHQMADQPTVVSDIQFFGRDWQLQFFEDSGLHAGNRNWVLWAVLIGGMMFAGVLAAFLLTVTARTESVQRLVQQRTSELSLANMDLERSNEDLEQFAYAASHDLKSPLRAIDNLTQWIGEDAIDVLPDESKEHLQKVKSRIVQMEKLLSDLLAYARVGRGGGKPEELSTKAILDEIVDLIPRPTGLKVEVAADIPNVRSSRAPLELVFRNLISNAVQHHDKPDGTVHVSSTTNEKFHEFKVSDDGPGIPAEYHTKIFQMFQSLKPKNDKGGSGMGLAMVKKVIENAGGYIAVESNVGESTTFRFGWPKQMNV